MVPLVLSRPGNWCVDLHQSTSITVAWFGSNQGRLCFSILHSTMIHMTGHQTTQLCQLINTTHLCLQTTFLWWFSDIPAVAPAEAIKHFLKALENFYPSATGLFEEKRVSQIKIHLESPVVWLQYHSSFLFSLYFNLLRNNFDLTCCANNQEQEMMCIKFPKMLGSMWNICNEMPPEDRPCFLLLSVVFSHPIKWHRDCCSISNPVSPCNFLGSKLSSVLRNKQMQQSTAWHCYNSWFAAFEKGAK